MSREYGIESTLLIWDFVFLGVHQSKIDLANENQEKLMFKPPGSDPFINLEFISTAMIILLKEELMENDFSMCLGMLMSYKEPESPLGIIDKAVKIR